MKIVISGYGKMGHMIESILIDKGIDYIPTENVAEIDIETAKQCVCIDFTTPDAFRSNYRLLADRFGAVVVGTTGWNDIKDEVLQYFRNSGTTMIYVTLSTCGSEKTVFTA